MMHVLYKQILKGRGYEVRLCSDGQELLDSFAEDPADLVVVDLDMPNLSGLEAITQLRMQPEGAMVPVIVVSAADTEEAMLECLSRGADDYILKPLKRTELLAKVAAAFRRKEVVVLTSRGFTMGTLFNGRYRIEELLGAGGSSTVYRATDTEADPPGAVAVKVFDFSDCLGRDQHFLTSFLREAYEHSRLDHPNILKLRDFGHTGTFYFMSMDLLEGDSLEEILLNQGAMPFRKAAWIGREVTRALEYLSARELIHRDVKPKNIMITSDEQVKLLDFGLARRCTDETLSFDNEFRGTPHFVSPEYVTGDQNLDIRTDIYSLGITLYMMVSAKLPIKGNSPMAIAENQLRVVPMSLKELCPEVSAEFSGLVDQMLAKERNDRPGLDELMATLETI